MYTKADDLITVLTKCNTVYIERLVGWIKYFIHHLIGKLQTFTIWLSKVAMNSFSEDNNMPHKNQHYSICVEQQNQW